MKKKKFIRGILLMLAILIFLTKSSTEQTVEKDRKISLDMKQEPIPDVLKAIEKQTDVYFTYNNDELKNIPPIDLKVKNTTIDDVLKKIFKATGLTYEYRGKAIVLHPSNRMKEANQDSHVQPQPSRDTACIPVITGKVVNEQGIPLEGVSVMIQGTSQGTETNKNGFFSLNDVPADDLLEFAFIGYQVHDEPVDANSNFTVVLMPNENNLNDVITKGYYSTTQELNTGNVSLVDADIIERQPLGDPMAALQGRVPGLQITQTSGMPGAELTVRLRGQNSIANGNDPLYIIDGIPYNSSSLASSSPFVNGASIYESPFNTLDPNSIESIEVLKDADATAIYGSRGANGVILITTKKGNTGKASTNFNVYEGIGKIDNKLDLLNTQQYLEMRHEAFKNDGATPTSADYDINGIWDTARYTDWQKSLIGGTSHITNAEGNISGGNEQINFTFGGGYRKETTVFPGNFYSRKYSIHSSISYLSLSKKFNATLSTSYVNGYSYYPASDLTSQILLPPDAPPIYNNDGTLNWQNSTWTNPFAALNKEDDATTNNFISSLQTSLKLLPGLLLKSNFGYNRFELSQIDLSPGTSINPQYIQPTIRSNHFGTASRESWIFEPQLSYTKENPEGQFDFLIGTTLQQEINNSTYQSASGFSSDNDIKNAAAATNLKIVSNDYSKYHYEAIYGRIGYNFRQKYILNLTARRDGSSRFGPGKQFGNFYSIGGAWIFSKEGFTKKALPFLSFGKLRASYGSTGNDQLGDYKFLSTYSVYRYSYQNIISYYPTQLTNPYFGWERVNKLEIGADLGFFNNGLLFNVSWYNDRTGNQLVGYALPFITGFSSIQANLPAIIQNTGLEFEVNSINIKRKSFRWETHANVSFPRNKLISFPGLAGSSYATTYAIGKPLSIQFLYHSLGVDQQTGLYQFSDLNNDGNISTPQDLKPVFVGIRFSGGIENDITFKQFRLNFFFQFVKQNGQAFLFNGLPGSIYTANQPIEVLNRWRNPGDNSNIAKFSQDFGDVYTSVSNMQYYGDGLIQDASFIRLKNIALSWQLPEKLKKAVHLNEGSIYVQCQNLFTITKYKGLDPETQSQGYILPPLRIITAGIILNL